MLCSIRRRMLRPHGLLLFLSIAIAALFLANPSRASDSVRK
jgi:hypothetical protein